MIKEKLINLDLDIYKETLDNGLLVYICPMNRHDVHASISTKFGNDILDFKPIGKTEYLTIPTGTAHFLEHKMFAKEDGPDPMSVFASNGAYSNAYTSSKVTRYYFTGASHFYENLKTLLDCITKPYFTKENIAKEQGIIAQEIKAGLDDPEHALYFAALQGVFKNHPHKYPVFGYLNTISKLNKEILYDTYNTFYHPSNMFMVITGNVNPEKTINYIKEYFHNKKYPEKQKIEKKHYNEPKIVSKEKNQISMDVTNKLLTFSYKLKPNYDRFKSRTYLLIYLNTLFGSISNFYDENFKDKNSLSDVSFYLESVDDYLIAHFDVEVLDKEDIIAKIDKLINTKQVNKETFNLFIKNVLNDLILTTENVLSMANLIVNQIIEYNDFDAKIYDKYQKLNFEEYKEYINSLDFKNHTLSIITKNN